MLKTGFGNNKLLFWAKIFNVFYWIQQDLTSPNFITLLKMLKSSQISHFSHLKGNTALGYALAQSLDITRSEITDKLKHNQYLITVIKINKQELVCLMLIWFYAQPRKGYLTWKCMVTIQSHCQL